MTCDSVHCRKNALPTGIFYLRTKGGRLCLRVGSFQSWHSTLAPNDGALSWVAGTSKQDSITGDNRFSSESGSWVGFVGAGSDCT